MSFRKSFTKLKKINPKQYLKKILTWVRTNRNQLLLASVLIFLCIFLIISLYIRSILQVIPDPDKLIERDANESVIIHDKNGLELYRFFESENREFIAIEDINSNTIWALLAAEDKEFYEHEGVDFVGTTKCTLNVITKGLTGLGCGGSTITQQLVRNTILSDTEGDAAFERSATRKIKEIIVAMEVERTLSKDQIIQLYMNEVPLGGLNYGFQAASRAYFDKDLKDLTLAESAMLVGLLPSPSSYNPIFGNTEYAYERQNYVLDQLELIKDEAGITQEEIDAARNEQLEFTATGLTEIYAPHFVFYVRNELIDIIGEDQFKQGGLVVTTSLDYDVQTIAEQELRTTVRQYNEEFLIHNGGLVAVEPQSNEILAMVGSIDFFNDEEIKVSGSINMVTAERQMASLVKPYTMLGAFVDGYGPYTVIPDSLAMDFGYNVTNYDGKYNGIVDIRETLTRSLNIPALYIFELIGDQSFLNIVDRMGIEMKEEQRDDGITLGLGSADMTLLDNVNAYSVFAREGTKKELTSILEVQDKNGDVIYTAEHTEQPLFNERDIYLLNWSLCDLGNYQDRFGQEEYIVNGQAVCGKTGTSDTSKDLLAILYHKNLVVGVWTGNSDGSSPLGTVSSRTSLPLASNFMSIMDATYPVELFEAPDEVVSVTVCEDSGKYPSRGGPCTTKTSVANARSVISADQRGSLTICNFNGKIPTNLDTARANGYTTEYQLIQNKIPLPQYQEAYNAILRNTYPNTLTSDPGSEVCLAPSDDATGYSTNEPVINIQVPLSGNQIQRGSTINIQANVDTLYMPPDIYFDEIIRIGSFEEYISSTTTPFASLINTEITIPTDMPLGSQQLSIVLQGTSNTYSKSVSITIIE